MALSRIRQEDEEELKDSLPYHWLKGLAQNEEKIGIVIPPPRVAPARHRHGEHLCYCPTCDYQISVEEGQKCNLIECPLCGTKMRAVSTGEYRSTGISQAEAVPIGPVLLTFGFLGLLAYMIGKRPFG